MLVIQEIEEILKEYPEHPYQVAFSIQELRHKLILHVLDRIPNHYVIVEDTRELPKDPTCLYASFGEKVMMEILIRQSIAHLLEENADWVRDNITQKDNLVKESQKL